MEVCTKVRIKGGPHKGMLATVEGSPDIVTGLIPIYSLHEKFQFSIGGGWVMYQHEDNLEVYEVESDLKPLQTKVVNLADYRLT